VLHVQNVLRDATTTGARIVTPPLPITGKRKVEFSCSDGLITPAARRPAPDTQGTSDAPTPSTSRKLGDTAGKLAYVAVLPGDTYPRKSSGQPTPIATGSDYSEPAASCEAANSSMCVDMSGSLGSMPAATTEAGAVPAGERPNITPVFVTGVTDTWLRTSCPSSLSAQMKGEKLMIVPGTADGFRATVSALRSLDGSKGVTFPTFSLPEDRCVRLLVKNLGRQMPESVVREELEALGIRVQGVMQLRSGSRDQDAARNRSSASHFVVSVARGPEVQKVRSLTELCGLRVSVETYVAPKDPLQCRRCQRFGHTQRNCGYTPRCVACGKPHPSGECSTPRQQHKCCSCGGNHTANYRGCAKWKENKAALLASTRTVQPVARLQRKRPAPSLLRNRRV
jgi:hypothetical protein